MHHNSILVIDDEPDNFDVIEALLSDQDYQLHYAANGQEAMIALETYEPDLILMDVIMPGMSGIEVCRRIKTSSRWQTIPIIMVTALSTKSDLANCLSAGADDFLTKPINGVELRARVQSMLRIRHQYNALQALLKLREDMVNMMVHDLRNPLTIISVGLGMIANPHMPAQKQRDRIEQVQTAAKQLQALIDDLLLMAKIEAGKLKLTPSNISLNTLITSALADMAVIANQKQVTLSSTLLDRDINICVDASLLRRVLDNLLSNAIKFAPRHSQVTIGIAEVATTGIDIQVRDVGPGVPEGLQQKIFEKYEIGTRLPNISQLGLGLAFCKMVIEAHGGQISVKNHQPQGAIFTIHLPLQ